MENDLDEFQPISFFNGRKILQFIAKQSGASKMVEQKTESRFFVHQRKREKKIKCNENIKSNPFGTFP